MRLECPSLGVAPARLQAPIRDLCIDRRTMGFRLVSGCNSQTVRNALGTRFRSLTIRDRSLAQ